MKKKISRKERLEHIKKCGINLDDDGRIRVDNSVLSKLKPIPFGNHCEEIIIKDKNLMGFRARVSGGGQHAFVFRYRPKGKDENGKYFEKVNKAIGPWYDKHDPKEKHLIGITPAVARKMAEEMKAKLVRGEDPNVVVVRRSKGKTLCDVSKMWIENRAKSYKSYNNFLSIYNVYLNQKSKHPLHKNLYRLPEMDIVNKAIVELTKDDYLNFHRSVSKSSKVQANRVLELIRLVEQYAEENGVIKKRVAHFKKKELNKEIDRLDREDPYSPLDLKKYKKAMLQLIKKDPDKFRVPCFALRGACLIGARSKDQVFNLKWDQINFKKNTIKYLDTKNDEPMELEIDYQFKAVLRIMLQHKKTINHRDKRFAYVFPTLSKKSKTKYLKDPRKTHNTIIKLAGLEYKCIHFLRHSWATNSYAATGDSLGVQELGGWKDHKSVEKYIKVSKEVKRKRLKQIAAYNNKSHAR